MQSAGQGDTCADMRLSITLWAIHSEQININNALSYQQVYSVCGASVSFTGNTGAHCKTLLKPTLIFHLPKCV